MSPATVSVLASSTQVFTATVRDVGNHDVPTIASIAWSITGDPTSCTLQSSATFGSFSGQSMAAIDVRLPAPLGVDVSAQPITGTVPLTVSFAASPSGGVPPYAFQWDFGDGGTSTSQNPTHTYQVAGTYIVTLTVTDAGGRTTKTTEIIEASGAGIAPSGGGLPDLVIYALVAAVAVGIVGSILWRRRSRTPHTSSAAPVTAISLDDRPATRLRE